MDNTEILFSMDKNADKSKPSSPQSSGNLQIPSQICLTDEDIDHVLADYSYSVQNLVKSESKDVFTTIFDNLDKEETENTDFNNIEVNGTPLDEFTDMKNLSQNNMEETHSNHSGDKGVPCKTEFIEITIPTIENEKNYNPEEFHTELDENAYALGIGVAEFMNHEYADNNPIDNQSISATNVSNVDYEQYLPAFSTLQPFINHGDVDPLRKGEYVTTTYTGSTSNNKVDVQNINKRRDANQTVVGLQNGCEDKNYINKIPIYQTEQSFNEGNAIIISDSSEIEISSADEDDLPLSRFKVTISTYSDSDDDNDPCNGYHSSDFEFISESEAEKYAIVTKNEDRSTKKKHTKKDVSSDTENTPKVSTAMVKKECNDNKSCVDNSNLPGPSNARRNYYGINYIRCRNNNFSNGEDHRVPEGQNYLALFHGIYDPFLIISENKSIYFRAKATMDIDFENVGFDMQALNEWNEDLNVSEECKQAADETRKRIMRMYPDANAKHPRRRF